MTCALTGKLAFVEKDIAGSEGQEVFSERKGLNLFQNKATFDTPDRLLVRCNMAEYVTQRKAMQAAGWQHCASTPF